MSSTQRMMDLTCTPPVLIGDSHLKNWLVIGSGGFGQIHKARHVEWGLDVAIKLLHYNDGSSSLLLREADLMRQGGSPYVLRVLGVYQGRPPSSGPSSQLGLVMEFMERGSLAALQDALSGPPPWPLAYRLAHQIALGMNFLHRLPTPLLHLDLKPSNVLLDDSLNAKLTDFGLARVYYSISKAQKKKNAGEEGGTTSYMPPEAFDVSYKPTKASDVYSYGILLWSIITGKQPYVNAFSSMVRFRIPRGDRPPLESVECGRAPELGQLVELMERCWDPVPDNRPPFLECLTVTEGLFEKHKQGIKDTIHDVLTTLDSASEQRTMTRDLSALHVQDSSGSPPESPNHLKTGPPPTQETAGGLPSKQQDTERDQEWPSSPRPMRTSHTDPVLSSTNREPSPHTFVSNDKWKTPSPAPVGKQDRKVSTASVVDNLRATASRFQRQSSHPQPVHTNISMSNMWGVQIGNGNSMFIDAPDTAGPLSRQRHPTAPPRVNFPPAQPAGHKDKS